MAVKRGFIVYLAGPIDDVTHDEAWRWRDAVAAAFPSVVFFDPLWAWRNATTGGDVVGGAVAFGCRAMLQRVDGVLANLSGEGRGFGTIREIEFARLHGKPVAVAGQIQSLFACDCLEGETVMDAMTILLQHLADKANEPTLFDWLTGQQADDDE